MKLTQFKKFAPVLVAGLLLSGCCCTGSCPFKSQEEQKISVFAKFVLQTAKERNLTIAEAADRLYELGIRGFDIGPRDKELDALCATKLKPINFYFFPNMFAEDNGAADRDFAIAQAVKYGVPRIMVVPPNFTKNGDQEKEFARILESMKSFVAEAKKHNITITVEDFGGTSNCCSYSKYLKRFLDEIPDIRFALDTGNLYYASRGESIVDMMNYAKGRIGHVHIKDQTKEDSRKYATLALGAVPNEKVIKTVHASGYDGWYTLENPVGDTYLDTVRQVAILKAWFAGK